MELLELPIFQKILISPNQRISAFHALMAVSHMSLHSPVTSTWQTIISQIRDKLLHFDLLLE